MLLLKKISIGFIALFAINIAQAGGFIANYGYGVATSSVTVDDSDSSTKPSDTFVTPIHLFIYAEMSNTSRLAIEFYHSTYKFEGSKGDPLFIGQEVRNTGVNFIYQEELRITSSFRPILGAGLSFSKAVFEGRHSVNTDGNLITKYPNKDEFLIGVVITAGYEFNMSDSLGLGIRVMQSLGTKIEETQGMMILVYKP